MFRLSALALLVASVAPAAPVPKEKEKDKLYFPVVEGSKRVVAVTTADGTTTESTETVTKVEEKDGTYTVALERTTAGKQMPTRVYKAVAGGLSWKFSGDAEEAEPVSVFKPGAKAGDMWTSERKTDGLKYTFTLGQEEEVEVTAGKYKALKVEFQTEQGGRVIKSTAWYAAGIGLVKQVSEEKGSILTVELKSFTPGKGEKKDEPKKDK